MNLKKRLNIRDIYKFIAILLMLLDHIGLYIFNGNLWFRCIGRLSYPIFAFLYGTNFKKNNYKLLFIGIYLAVFNLLIKNTIYFNILICFFISGILVKIYDTLKTTKIVFLEILIILHFFIQRYFEYGIFTFLFMITRSKNKKGLLIVLILYFLEELYIFKFNLIQMILLLNLLICELYCFFIYSNNDIKENKLNNTIKIISRNSMEFYLLQFILFKLLS